MVDNDSERCWNYVCGTNFNSNCNSNHVLKAIAYYKVYLRTVWHEY